MADNLSMTGNGTESGEREPVVLAVDTSSPQAGLAIVRGALTLSVITDESGRPHSQTLFQNLEQLLGSANLTPAQLDAFAVVTGPGSFTGLRVGMAAIRGLGHTLDRPALGVTTLDALALAAGVEGKTLALIDALRGEVFCGLREVRLKKNSWSVKMLGQDCSARPEIALARFAPLLAGSEVTVIGTGAARYQEMIAREFELHHARPTLILQQPPLAATVAQYAAQKTGAGPWPELQAYYLRSADAELKISTHE
jgi:tRNA threonylcarbamoyladenosine biosynthesis protein TsaB